MKKNITLLTLLFFISGILLISCDQKEKLSQNNLSVAIEPAELHLHSIVNTMTAGESQIFTAIVRNGKGNIIDVDVIWTVDTVSSGSLSANVGKSTRFTMGSSEQATLTADYGGALCRFVISKYTPPTN
jgi:hypothetical protein